MRNRLPLIALGFAVLLPREATPLTLPITGAAPLPANVNLLLPFPAGKRVRIAAGYGPNAGSSLHKDTNATSKTNDFYALDLVYADEAQGGLGLPVVASLAGTVAKAGWATQGWANYGQRIILRHDLGDGHVYYTGYAHLNSIDAAISEGAVVAQGQPLGTLGRSCLGALSCSSFSNPHVHFFMHRDSSIGGSGTGGSYGGNAVVPELLDGAEDVSQWDYITSSNSGQVVCGDGFCNGGETPASCPSDCHTCAPVPPLGREVDDQEICFKRSGTPAYWTREDAGYGGALWWTYATAALTSDNSAQWTLSFAEAGDYRLEAFTTAPFGASGKARYLVRHGASQQDQLLDQSAANGWNEIGVYRFESGGDQWVQLGDNTGEPESTRTKLVFDALRLTRVDPPVIDAGSDSGVSAGFDAGTPDRDGGTGTVIAGGGDPDGGQSPAVGCSCNAGWGAAAPALLVALGAIARRRRR